MGIHENEVYHKRLHLSSGEKITWKRIGSCKADNIPNLTDSYEIYDSKGALYAFYIYVLITERPAIKLLKILYWYN